MPAAAQDEAAAEEAVEQTASRQLQGLEEITVTARKRAEDLQAVPVSISTITARDFENQSLQLFEDIQFQTPGLNIRQTVGRKHILGAMIRGFFELDSLITTDPAIGFYIDDIYSARISGTNMSLFDIDRIETLKGPQGVLFGKNNIGGAIKVHSKQPDGTTGGFGRVRLGTHGQTDFEGAVSFPIRAETLSARVAFLSHHRDGVSEHLSWPPDDALCGAGCLARAPANSVPDSFQNNALGGRVSLLYTPSDRFEALLQIQRLRSREPDPNPAVAIAFDHNSLFLRTGIGAGWTPVDLLDRVLEDNEPWDSYTSFKGQVDLDVWAYTYNMTWDFDSFSIRSLSGWRKFTTDEVRDQDGTPWNLRHTASETGSRQFTQELQINGTLFEDRLTYTSGVFWGNQRTSYFEGSFGSLF
ncbi:MAG: TonB-dependent receptor plug domain-containing protein, partial [Proteobacteria bacterium]|nr:TonB-dependent receptor plug domain-containing protein [Pseudomonadota bacterium]